MSTIGKIVGVAVSAALIVATAAAADPIRPASPAIASYASPIAGAQQFGTAARSGAKTAGQSNLAGGSNFLVAILLAAIAGIGGYEIAKHHFQNKNNSTSPGV